MGLPLVTDQPNCKTRFLQSRPLAMTVKRFLRNIRLDASDAEVFDNACEPGEWAVTGAFMFLNDTDESLTGKRLQAFRNGFLGVQSFGWSTLAEVTEISDDEYQTVIQQLAQGLIAHLGAPDLEAALPVATAEVEYACEACEQPVGTLIALSRELTDEGIAENLHVVKPAAPGHDALKIWEWSPDDQD